MPERPTSRPTWTKRLMGVAAVAAAAAVILQVEFVTLDDTTSVAQRPRLPSADDNGGGEVRFRTYLTGYSWWDNTPPGSAAIARPVIRHRAGGTGTYDDPITLAVGHRIRHGIQRMDFPAGTRFYFPAIRKYAIVEDVCGDGPRPQLGPCHIGHKGYPWLDIYVGARSGNPNAANRCMRSITGLQDAILNPRRGHPVVPGEIFTSTCAGA